MSAVYPPERELSVWTSTLRRTRETIKHLPRDSIAWKSLDEIDAGLCDGKTYEQIEEEMPEDFAARKRDKFHYRYPRGESYQDVVHRLESVIIELQRQDGPILIVSHQATLRCLYSYISGKSPEECPHLPIPLHTVIQLTPKAYGCEEVRHKLL
jgi:broad specificity phosphatase PhoE